MKGWTGAALLLAATMSPTKAAACSTASGETALIHDGLPADLDPRLVAARVDIEGVDPDALHKQGVTARVGRILQGDYAGDLLILYSADTSCSRPFRNGRSGLIIGIPIGLEDGILALEALEVSFGGGYRIPDRYRVPEAYLESVRSRARGQ